MFAFNSYPDLIVPNLPTAYSISREEREQEKEILLQSTHS